MILRDFECKECRHIFEDLEISDAERECAGDGETCVGIVCPECESYHAEPTFNGKSALPCKNMVPTYPGCKKQKAGYMHTKHADQAATRIQSGPGGCQGPSA